MFLFVYIFDLPSLFIFLFLELSLKKLFFPFSILFYFLNILFQVFALESWKNYKLRNDSIIVDHFHGLLKSRVICPHCEYLSVAFDPFSSLSLPLPLNQENQFKVKSMTIKATLF